MKLGISAPLISPSTLIAANLAIAGKTEDAHQSLLQIDSTNLVKRRADG
jgi:hypothetical protein